MWLILLASHFFRNFARFFRQVEPAAHRRIRHVARDSFPEGAVESFRVFFCVERTLGSFCMRLQFRRE